MMKNCINLHLNRRSGFNLIELIVVVSILVILSAITVQQFYNQLNRARVSAHNANVATLRSAALLAIAENGVPEAVISWLDVDGTIDAGYDPDCFIDEWPDLPQGLTYAPGFSGGSTITYQVQINSGGIIEVSPAKIT